MDISTLWSLVLCEIFSGIQVIDTKLDVWDKV